MTGKLYTTAAVAAALLVLAPSARATLDCSILVDGTNVGNCTTSNTGAIAFNSTTASPLFSSLSLTANGSPDLPQPDLSSVTLDVSTSGTFTGSHVLTVDVFQTTIAAPVGTQLETTATINNLIGVPGPTTLTDAFNGTNASLGTVLQSQTFATGVTGQGGPLFNTLATPLDADAQQFAITFTAANQSANETLQLQGVRAIREPSSLALLGAGLCLLSFIIGWRRQIG